LRDDDVSVTTPSPRQSSTISNLLNYDKNINSVQLAEQANNTNSAKKTSTSPMSVSNLMNFPTLEPVSSNNTDIINTPDTSDISKNKSISKGNEMNKKEANKLKKNEDATKKKAVTPNFDLKDKEDKEKVKDSEKERPEKENGSTIIDIEIPLSTHNDVHTEHNFAKMVEEKYGAQETASTKALWNFENDYADADGDYDEEDEEEAELTPLNNSNSVTPSNATPSIATPSNATPSNAIPSNAIPSNAIPSNAIPSNAIPNTVIQNDYEEEEDEIVKALQIKFTPGMSDIEKETLVLREIHRRKMVNNKRIGKYDVDDPFIDDEELVYEEETNANADGWFIWHGKLDVAKKKKPTEPVKNDTLSKSKGKQSMLKPQSNTNTINMTISPPVSARNDIKEVQIAPAPSPQHSSPGNAEKRKFHEPVNKSSIPKKPKKNLATVASNSSSESTSTSTSKPTANKSASIIIGSFGF
jgi:hypothetical protein